MRSIKKMSSTESGTNLQIEFDPSSPLIVCGVELGAHLQVQRQKDENTTVSHSRETIEATLEYRQR